MGEKMVLDKLNEMVKRVLERKKSIVAAVIKMGKEAGK